MNIGGNFALSKGLLEELVSPQNKIIMVLGNSDSGKTTLVESLVPLFENKRLALVDLDTGQSRIGPPTTVAWGFAPREFSWGKVVVEDFYFTGSASPIRNLLPMITGSKIIVDLAQQASDKVIIDTSGFISEGSGWVLKENKIELLRPDVILALQHQRELEPILLSFKGRIKPKIFRLSVPPAIKIKTPEARTAFRERQFRNYFKGARNVEISWEKIGLRNTILGKQTPWENLEFLSQALGCSVLHAEGKSHLFLIYEGEVARGGLLQVKKECGARRVHLDSAQAYFYRLVCLKEESGRDRVLGIITSIDFSQKKLFILAPLPDDLKVGSVVFGQLRVDPSGKQLPFF